MKLIFLLLTVCLLLCACNKNPPGNGLLWQCENSLQPDSAAVATQIAGSWRWVQQRVTRSNEVQMADKIVIATFNSDSTFTVLENASVTAQGNWKLVMFSDSTWQLALTSPSSYLYGFISFCNDKVLFTDSYVDGNDNLFEKAE